MPAKYRLPLVFAFLTLFLVVPLMVQTVLSADPPPTENPGEPTPTEMVLDPSSTPEGAQLTETPELIEPTATLEVIDPSPTAEVTETATPAEEEEEIPVPTPMPSEPEMRLMGFAPEPGEDPEPPPAIQGELEISLIRDDEYYPQVSYSASAEMYLVIWQDHEGSGLTNIWGRYVFPDGQMPHAPFLIAEDREGPVETRLYAGKEAFMLLWREGEDIHAGSLYLQFIQGYDPVIPLHLTERLVHTPVEEKFAAAYNQSQNEFLVLWLDQRNPNLSMYRRAEVYGKIVDGNGIEVKAETSLTPVPANPSNPEIENAPIETGQLDAAFDPDLGWYLLTYCIYKTTYNSEDVWARRVFADLTLSGSPFAITPNTYGGQWGARIELNKSLNQYLITWEDNRFNQWDIFGRILAGSTAFVGSPFGIVIGSDFQIWHEVAALPADSPLPAYALTYQREQANDVEVRYLDDGGLPIGAPLVLSYRDYHRRQIPDLTAGHGDPAQVLVVWQDSLLNYQKDIHGRFLDIDEFQGAHLVSPINYAMVLSLKPTLRWETVSGAASYFIELYRYTDGQLPPEPYRSLTVDAVSSRDPENQERHYYKISSPLSSGLTQEEAGYLWRVSARDVNGASLGTSLFSVFQIPPLGVETENPYWSNFDDLVYKWSEERDLPPNLVKAVLAKESGNMHNWFGLGPEYGYLYEAGYDARACKPNSTDYNICQRSQVVPFLEPAAGVPEELPANIPASFWASSPTIARLALPYNSSIISNWQSLGRATGCGDFTEPSSGFYDCVVDYYGGNVPKAQYRVMVGYGLLGVNFWTNIRILNSTLPEGASPYSPETLYQADTNIRVGTQVLSNNRCQWSRASGLRSPFLDPASPEHIYLNSTHYSLEDFQMWRQVLGAYNGYGFYYPLGSGRQSLVGAVYARFFGEDLKGNPYPSTYPVDVFNLAERGIEVAIQVEPGPAQRYQGRSYGATPGDDTWDTGPLACPLPEHAGSLQSEQVAGAAGSPGLLSAASQVPSGVILDQQAVDFQGDGDPEWAVLVWEGDPEVHDLHQAAVLIYSDQSKQDLLWISPAIPDVTTAGYGFIGQLEGAMRQVYQAEFGVGLHSFRVYFASWEGGQFGFSSFTDSTGLVEDHLVSSGGGAFLQPDGSIILLNRGSIPGELTDITIYAPGEGSYIEERSYTYDNYAADTTLPQTTFALEPPVVPEGWIGHETASLTSADDSGVAYLDYALSGAVPGEVQRSYLSQVVLPLQEGIWSLDYQATDIYGNQEELKSIQLRVDSTPPVSDMQLVGYQDPESGDFLSDVAVVISSVDLLADGSPGSGVERIEISLDEGISWQIYRSVLLISEAGEYSIWARSLDRAFNLEKPLMAHFEILPHGITLSPLENEEAAEGDELSIWVEFVDLDTTASHSAGVFWSDGSPSTAALVVEFGGGSGLFQAQHIYRDNGTYSAFWLIENDHQVLLVEDFQVLITNLPPLVDAGEDLGVGPGLELSFAGFFTDPGALDTHTIRWDFGDGSSEEGTLTPSHTYSAAGSYTATLTVTDDDGGVGSDTLTVTVSNQPPVVDLGEAAAVDEGGEFSRRASFSDPDSSSWTGEVDYGLEDGFEPLDLNPDGSFDLGQSYPNNGLFIISVRISDDQSAVGEDTLALTVNNVAPLLSLEGTTALNEGDIFTGGGSFTDPGADSWTVTVDYGDGSGIKDLTLQGMVFTLERVYPEDGSYPVQVCVSDDDGGEDCEFLALVVENLPPAVSAGPDQQGTTEDDFTFSGSFQDPGIEDTHSILWDFGDGITAEGSLAPQHSYAGPGSYTVTLTVSDDEGASGTDSLTVTVEQSAGSELVALSDRRGKNCLELDLGDGDYSWYAENGKIYRGTAELVERGGIILFRSSDAGKTYLSGLLLTRTEMGTARLRVGSWLHWKLFFILDNDFSEPGTCH